MKIVYCIIGLFNPGGMERIIAEKANYLAENGNEVFIITTDQKERPVFFELSSTVRVIDLGINYLDADSFVKKIYTYSKKKSKHKRLLTKLINEYRPDIVISTMGTEFFFLTSLPDKSKKIAEIHFSKQYRIYSKRKFPLNIVDYYMTLRENKLMRRYDKFVILTEEDKESWKFQRNIEVIPNFIELDEETPTYRQKRLIAVGRLTYQKGFERLIKACRLISDEIRKYKYKIDIFGDGELRDELQTEIEKYGLDDIVCLKGISRNITDEYKSSKGLILSSRYEGLPMVLLEAMANGVIPIAFECPCGPKDIIKDKINGFIVPKNDIEELSKAILHFIQSSETHELMSIKARERANDFEKELIMTKWEILFNKVINRND